MYSGFERYYFEAACARHSLWTNDEIPTREAAWKEWIKMYIGK
jgi:hypothetical protein